MKTNIKPKVLTFLGLTPFIIALLIAAYDQLNGSLLFDHDIKFARFKSYALAHSYGVVIVSFLAGIQWGISLGKDQDKQYFIISNVLALLAWLSLWAFASLMGMLLLAGCFVLAWWVDRHAYKASLIENWFYLLRSQVTLAVVATLMLLMLLNQ